MANVLVGHRVILSREISVGEAASFEIEAGQLVQLIDMAGGQVAGLVAWGGESLSERLSTATTMTSNSSIVVKQGDKLFGTEATPIFEMVEDSVGRHDLLTGPIPAPEPASAAATVVPTTREPLKAAAREIGMEDADISDPINFFKHVIIKSKGELEVKESFSERGDTVVLRALTPARVVVVNAYHERRPGVTAGKQAIEKGGRFLVRVYR
ncbi:MAG TPA: urea carboxylase-associated family protein [Thermomicrobiales bacterium]|jgi:uncharacterized protein YcgI (DUF1989 family)|nr:urea carboxylase-associated family protein [Thermomicrobiales bacterium]